MRYSATGRARVAGGRRPRHRHGTRAGQHRGLGCIAASFLLGGTLRPSLIVLGVTMPGLIVQDTWRSAFFCNLRGSLRLRERPGLDDRTGRPGRAVLVAGAGSTPAFLLAWAGAANIAAVFGCLQAGFMPLPQHARRWLFGQRDLGPRYLVEAIARSAAQAGAVYATAGFAGLAAAGALRAAQVALGPLNILNMGVTSPAIAESVRIARRSPRRMLRAVTILGIVLVVVFVAWGVAMYLLPASVGEALLKRSWAPAHSVILPYTAVMAASGMLTAAHGRPAGDGCGQAQPALATGHRRAGRHRGAVGRGDLRRRRRRLRPRRGTVDGRHPVVAAAARVAVAEEEERRGARPRSSPWPGSTPAGREHV